MIFSLQRSFIIQQRAVIFRYFSQSLRKLLVVQSRQHSNEQLHEALRLGRTYSEQECEYILLGRSRHFVPSSKFYFGTGAIEILKQSLNEDRDVFINAVLSGIQIRNLETKLQCRVLDRIGLIVEIFASRAKTKEARLQVELALLQLSKTRLVRTLDSKGRPSGFGVNDSHEVVSARDRGRSGSVRGGLGGGGQGESEIALHRSRIVAQEKQLRLQIEDVKRTRNLHRNARKRNSTPVVAVVGYTNTGKSTVVSRLTKSELECDDLFFKTLDPITRRLQFRNGEACVLSDTVGFISELPICLFAAFRATLEEALYADIILHVLDSNATDIKKQRQQVYKTLQEIGISPDLLRDRTIEAYNKIDMLKTSEHTSLVTVPSSTGNQLLTSSYSRFKEFTAWVRTLQDEETGFIQRRVFVSAINGDGMSQLVRTIHATTKKC